MINENMIPKTIFFGSKFHFIKGKYSTAVNKKSNEDEKCLESISEKQL